jgi:hypothetical protein
MDVLHISFLHNLQLQQPSASEIQEHLSPSTNFNFVLTASSSLTQQPHHSSQTFSYGWHPQGLQKGVNLREQDLAGQWVAKNSQSQFCDCFVCFQSWCAVVWSRTQG